MLKSNQEQLIEVAVGGEIAHAKLKHLPQVAGDGSSFVGVGRAGIAFNVKVGDPAFGWAWGDHVEPGVGVSNPDPAANAALNTYACIGNEATITDATFDGKDAKLKGMVGTVTGKHDGRVLVYFPKRIVEKLCIGDRIQIRASGTGFKLGDHPHVSVMNCGPQLLKALNLTEKAGKVRVPVTKLVPGKLIGSGVGHGDLHANDIDLQAAGDAGREGALDQLRMGDLVAITDYDATHGARWQTDAVTIGVIVHGTSPVAGHGPGLCVLMTTAKKEGIEPIITRKANLADLLALT